MKIYAIYTDYGHEVPALSSLDVKEQPSRYVALQRPGGAFGFRIHFDKEKCSLTPASAWEKFINRQRDSIKLSSEALELAKKNLEFAEKQASQLR